MFRLGLLRAGDRWVKTWEVWVAGGGHAAEAGTEPA